jgi:hypothetical protein
MQCIPFIFLFAHLVSIFRVIGTFSCSPSLKIVLTPFASFSSVFARIGRALRSQSSQPFFSIFVIVRAHIVAVARSLALDAIICAIMGISHRFLSQGAMVRSGIDGETLMPFRLYHSGA